MLVTPRFSAQGTRDRRRALPGKRPARHGRSGTARAASLAAAAAMTRLVVGAGVIMSSVVACGPPPVFDGTTYREGKLAFRVGATPPEWRAVQVRGATIAFRDGPRGASILLDARCDQEDTDTPLPSLTAHLLAGTTEREFSVEDTVPFDGREALHTKVHAKLDGVLLAYDIYVLKKDGCTYDFVFVSPPASFDEGAASFERFATGFQTEEAPR